MNWYCYICFYWYTLTLDERGVDVFCMRVHCRTTLNFKRFLDTWDTTRYNLISSDRRRCSLECLLISWKLTKSLLHSTVLPLCHNRILNGNRCYLWYTSSLGVFNYSAPLIKKKLQHHHCRAEIRVLCCTGFDLSCKFWEITHELASFISTFFSAVSAGFRFINSCLQENIHCVSGLLSTNDG